MMNCPKVTVLKSELKYFVDSLKLLFHQTLHIVFKGTMWINKLLILSMSWSTREFQNPIMPTAMTPVEYAKLHTCMNREEG